MDRTLEFILEHWSQIKKSPKVLIIGLVIGVCLCRLFDNNRFQFLQDQLQAKDSLLIEYRERLGILKPLTSTYSLLSNIELKEKAEITINQMREFLVKDKINDEIIIKRMTDSATTHLPKSEQDNIWKLCQEELGRLAIYRSSTYNSKFKTTAILLRDAITARLPTTLALDSPSWLNYENPVNPIGMESVATHLERLAKSLPNNTKKNASDFK